MQHLDPGTISMAALDESLDSSSQEHLDACGSCTAEVRELNSVVLAARGDISAAPLESPDPQVWASIHEELGLQQSLLSDPLAGTSPAAPLEQGATVTQLTQQSDRSRSFTSRFLVAAATLGVLVGAGAVWAAQQLAVEPGPAVVAESELDPLEGFTARGTATVFAADDGVRTLQVTLTDEEADGYQEVWLIAPDLEQMYSLGVIGAGTSSLTIPASVDLEAFPIVDVSDEPLDGDPVHSGVSILRGTLAAAAG